MTSQLTPMSPQRHAAIRDMLVAEVHASLRPSGHRSWQRPTLLVATSMGAAAAVTAVAMVVVDPAAQPSYASWTAVPDTADLSTDERESLGDWRSRCTELDTGGIGFPGMEPPRWQPREVLVDRRGRFVFCVDIALGAPGEEHTLIGMAGLRADEGFGSLNTMTGVVRDEPVRLPRRDEVVLVGSGEAIPPEEGIHSLSVGEAFGLAGPDVTGVDIILASGTRVTATVDNGRWGAWWPEAEGPFDGAVLEVQTGKSVRTIDPDAVGL